MDQFKFLGNYPPTPPNYIFIPPSPENREYSRISSILAARDTLREISMHLNDRNALLMSGSHGDPNVNVFELMRTSVDISVPLHQVQSSPSLSPYRPQAVVLSISVIQKKNKRLLAVYSPYKEPSLTFSQQVSTRLLHP